MMHYGGTVLLTPFQLVCFLFLFYGFFSLCAWKAEYCTVKLGYI